MSAYVEECRREWKRLGVPDALAAEMAAELESDLAEAAADGVSAAEMLGESDPRVFAATWAKERGLVSDEPPRSRRRRVWIWVAVSFGVFVFLMVTLALFGFFATTVSYGPPAPPQAHRGVVIPNFVGMRACHAKRIAQESRLKVRNFPHSRCNAIVVSQGPPPHTLIEWPRGAHTIVKLRLRG
jgi:hypothetical protein